MPNNKRPVIAIGRSILGKSAFAVALVLAMAPFAAHAAVDLAADNATVSDAKAHGIIGEQGDGFIGVVRGDPDAGIMGSVAELNMLRMENYRKAAAGAGTTAEAEGRKAGQHLTDEVPAGQFYKPSGGGWRKK